MDALKMLSTSRRLVHPVVSCRATTRATTHQRCRATSSAIVAEENAEASLTAKFELACPICQKTKFSLARQPGGEELKCYRCARAFSGGPGYVDLTLTSGLTGSSYEQKNWAGTEIFRQGTVSSIYERGWRQMFAFSGFPGPDTEFGYAMDYLSPAYGETLIDMSCGSGLFTRRFASSGKFKNVIAADFSENMLRQTKSYLDSSNIDSRDVLLLRTDVARLPFETGSVSAIHAGAAIHCWPNPAAAMAEISRVLKPGGVFVGSTFLQPVAPLGELLGNDKLVQPLAGSVMNSTYKFWLEPELRDLMATVGLTAFQRQRNFRFILWSCRKPITA